MIGKLYRDGQLYTQEPIAVFDHDWASLANGVAIPLGVCILANELKPL
ncbi:MAG: hypothetical protein HC866_21770 [Leptolyngbyaceae cyanobacterium RU_5_1]|nr:hypothetical protein [Leptolyngbyaceae cyanobacterium RU_5_1]